MFRELWTRLIGAVGGAGLQADRHETGGRRELSNLDAGTAARANQSADPVGGHGGIPPNYVQSYDEGRPPH